MPMDPSCPMDPLHAHGPPLHAHGTPHAHGPPPFALLPQELNTLEGLTKKVIVLHAFFFVLFVFALRPQELDTMEDATKKEVAELRRKVETVDRELRPMEALCERKVRLSPSYHYSPRIRLPSPSLPILI